MKIPNEDTCGKCSFCSSRASRFVGPPEPKKARIAVVGMNPGKTELELGEYFVGPAGANLDIALAMLELTRADAHITNAVKCYTVPKEETVKANHINYCREYLDYELSIVDPELIVVAGDVALQAVCGLKGIMSKIKKLLWSLRYQTPVIAILHPAAILHNPKNKRTYLESVYYVKRFLGGELQSEADLGEYDIVNTRAGIDELTRLCKEAGHCCIDVENNQRMPYDPKCVLKCFSIAVRPRRSSCVPYAELPRHLQLYAMKAVGHLITAEGVDLLGHNLWFDLKHFTIPLEVEPKGELWDTQYEHYLLDENTAHGLKALAWEHTKLGGYEKAVDALGGPGHCDPCPELYLYNNIDTDVTERLHEIFLPQLKEQGLMHAYREIIMPAARVMGDMETRGILLDMDHANDLRTKAEEMLPDIVGKMRAIVEVGQFEANEDVVLNPRSPKHLQKILFEYLQLPIIKRTDKTQKPSTEAKILERLEEEHESLFCKLLLDYRLVYGLHSKYLGKLEELTDDNNRVHTSYLLHVARSGRTSSAGPNLQNIPVRGKDVLDVKNCFIPAPGNWLLEGDFNQHEYRIVAGVSHDKLMTKLFMDDRAIYEKVLRGEMSMKEYKLEYALDMHRANAAEMFGVPYGEVTSEQRRAAKGLSFGVVYGMAAYSLSEILGCSEKEAQQYLNAYFKKFCGVKQWKDQAIADLYQLGYVQTITGRRRRFPYVDTDAEREGVNTLIQGPASDFMLISLPGVSKKLNENSLGSKILAQVHDSILIDLVPDELYPVRDIMREYMENSGKNYIENIPLQADFSIGKTWGSLEDLWKWEERGGF